MYNFIKFVPLSELESLNNPNFGKEEAENIRHNNEVQKIRNAPFNERLKAILLSKEEEYHNEQLNAIRNAS